MFGLCVPVTVTLLSAVRLVLRLLSSLLSTDLSEFVLFSKKTVSDVPQLPSFSQKFSFELLSVSKESEFSVLVSEVEVALSSGEFPVNLSRFFSEIARFSLIIIRVLEFWVLGGRKFRVVVRKTRA